MNDTLQATLTAIIARAPAWIRHDLTSREPAIRTRGKETLAAMIASALTEANNR